MSEIIRNENKKENRVPFCRTEHFAKNIKYKKVLLTLKQQESSIEKNLINSMENMKLEPEVLQDVLHNMNDVSRKREITLENVMKSLKEITEEFKSVKSVTNSPEKIRKLDIGAYKQRLVKLSHKIRDFKESCQLQLLTQEQKKLESELYEFGSNLHKYEIATEKVGEPTFATSSSNKECHNYKEVQDFHALIAKTGHTGNWSNEDHLLFLNLRKKCSSIPALVAAMQVKCPDLTAEIIVNHEAWYKFYLNLREKQRSVVKEWRKQKEADRMKNSEKEVNVGVLGNISPEKTKSDITRKPSVYVTNKREIKIKKNIDVNEIIDGEKRKKELIRRWKEERERKCLMDEEQLKILTESKHAAQEKRKKERLSRIQGALAEYRQRKSMEVSCKTSKNFNSTAERKYNPTLIRAFRKQDEEYARKKKDLIARQKSVNNPMAKNIRSQAKIRDCSTLLNPTKVWSQRCKVQNPDTKEELKKLQYIKDVPRLSNMQCKNRESTEIKKALIFS